MDQKPITLLSLTLKTIIAHTVTYFLVGLVAFWLFDYATAFTSPTVSGFMRQTNDPIVALGPALQPCAGCCSPWCFTCCAKPCSAERTAG